MTHKTIAILGALAMLVVLVSTAFAHSALSGWAYPVECCSNQDCAQLADNDVRETAAGFYIISQNDFVPRAQAKLSGDEHFHVCRYQQTGNRICFFYPPKGF